MFRRKGLFVAVLILGIGLLIGLARRSVHPSSQKRSLLTYKSYPDQENIANWIVDMDTLEKWLVEQEGSVPLEVGEWSPSGKYLLLYTYEPRVILQVTDAFGREPRQIFDAQAHPELDIEGIFWAAGDILLFNTFDTKQRRSLIYTLDVENGAFEVLVEGVVSVIAPDGSIWLWMHGNPEGGFDYSLMNLAGERSPVTLGDRWARDHYFSPDGKQWAYFCNEGNARRSSYRLCLADVSAKDGVRNERLFSHEELPPNQISGSAYIWWSPDGKYIGIHVFNTETREHQFRAIDVVSGQVVFSRLFPTRTTWDLWSPRDDQVIDQDGVWLDLQSGEVRDFFAEVQETAQAYIVDWRLIEVSP